MTESKHTPGPWAVSSRPIPSTRPNLEGWVIDPVDPTKTIATAWGLKKNGEAQANARLIAAAPDLLAACERMAKHLKQNSMPEIQGIACDLFQAIAKAKGKSR